MMAGHRDRRQGRWSRSRVRARAGALRQVGRRLIVGWCWPSG